MDENKRCGACRHFGLALTSNYETSDGNVKESDSRYHTCKRVKHLETLGTTGLSAGTDVAHVVDGSDYHAALIVAEDFGCTLWETKSDAT